MITMIVWCGVEDERHLADIRLHPYLWWSIIYGAYATVWVSSF